MNMKDISTSHHDQIVAAGTDICVALRDKLCQRGL